MCANHKHFFRSDRSAVTDAFAAVFQVFRYTILDLQSVAANAGFGRYKPFSTRSSFYWLKKGRRDDAMLPISNFTSPGDLRYNLQ